MEPPPVNRRDLNFFIRMEEGAKKRIPLLSNYERALVKADVAVMPLDQQAEVLKFMQETGLGLDECLGQVETPNAPPPEPRWPYELGKPLVRPSLVWKLSTKMYEFHQWYMMAAADSREMFSLKVKPIDFYSEGEKVLWLDFKDIYKVYHHDAVNVSLISASAYLHIGFMDPSVVNQNHIQLSPEKTLVEVYNFLDKQTFKDFILLPYNFNFHWILTIIESERSHVTVFDSLRKDPVEYQDMQDMLGFLFPKFYPCYTISFIILIRNAWKQFIRTHKGPFKEKLTWNTDFPCLRQEPGNNLCGYYICEHMHRFSKEERVGAICEGLIGFLMDEVVNPKGEFYYNGR
uniref:Ubiquitin-like protease family profile domain-containing protein n=1 Tax=Setaria viridis TaxID=4556 RepID=A0A4U6TLJ1_SETVI|nr:hypothetical protein SEVIR_7G023700v2 [Setaria viridis]